MKLRIIVHTTLLLIFSLVFAQTRLYIGNMNIAVYSESPKGYLAIVIDDFGYNGEGTNEMLSLDLEITPAIMPFSKCSREDVIKIKEAGKEFIVHLPMESLTGKKSWVGDKGIFMNMTEDEVRKTTLEALEICNGAVGANNHMGSAITENEERLSAVFDVLKERDMLFLDSMTTPNTLSVRLGEEKGIPVLKRNVFLDSTQNIEKIKANILKAGNVAIKNKTAIAIGHVGPEGGLATYKALKETEPKLKEMGVKVVYISTLRDIMENKG